ncbi:uncharacterized protein LOC129614384 [Condylostylus longicornis]|uniref:uncharacterized protein LOC129614384 n=1 Tax=Condylostylus longicornis TaxID=2530218 RepID=UPI00244DAAA2|nr:uncharacterized protein LOC129614384 [Condylostylus longicornis]
MSLSRPVLNLLGTYFEQLFNHPIRTKSLTACVLASSANIVSQKLSSSNSINYKNVSAYALFALLFGGTVPHYFYTIIENTLRKDFRLRKYLIFACERLMLTPTMVTLSLYFLSRFEGADHKTSEDKTKKLFMSILTANWMFLSIPSFLNIYFVPPMLRVLMTNIIAFVWIIYVSKKRAKKQNDSAKD